MSLGVLAFQILVLFIGFNFYEIDCVISLRSYSLKYFEETNSLQLYTILQSNCSTIPFILFMISDLQLKSNVFSLIKHPKTVYLIIKKLKIKFDFTDKPLVNTVDNYQILEYTKVEINGVKIENIMSANMINLRQGENPFFFTYEEIKQIWNVIKPVYCQVTKNELNLVCILK